MWERNGSRGQLGEACWALGLLEHMIWGWWRFSLGDGSTVGKLSGCPVIDRELTERRTPSDMISRLLLKAWTLVNSGSTSSQGHCRFGFSGYQKTS